MVSEGKGEENEEGGCIMGPVGKGFDPTLPVKTRDGRRALIHEVFNDGTKRFSAFIEDEINPTKWVFMTYHHSGMFYFGVPCGNDLVNVPKKVKKEGWVNVYKVTGICKGGLIGRQSGIFDTKERAEKWATHYENSPHIYATVKIEWEEEQ